MSKRVLCSLFVAGALVVALAPNPVPAQVCAPLDDGRVAEAFYEGTVIFWEPVVEYREMVLTIGGPCEDIIKVFKKGEPISFDIREIERVTDGTYTWQLRRVATIDSGVQKDLEASRGTGEEDAVWWSYFQKGAIPEGPYVESASFTVERGVIIDPNQVEEKRATVASRARGAGSALAAGLTPGSSDEAAGGNGLATRDQVIPDDLIVQGSACVGFDCVNNESFGFDTIRLKENNLRIQFNDTSVGSFPTGNWQIRANSSSSGGQSFLGFVDQGASGTTETGTLVFAVEAAARANALYVESDGDVGLGTSNPVLDFHISTSNTPGIRLEQTNAGGFTAQTWDIAGNEANFFVRDVTGGSRLPFRIRPDAPTSSIDISGSGNVGIGTASPTSRLDLVDGQVEIGGHSIGERSGTIEDLQVNALRNTIYNIDSDNNSTNASFSVSRDGSVNAVVLVAREDGLVGVNRQTPSFPFHVGTDATNGNGAHVTAAGIWTDGSSRVNKTGIRRLELDDAMAAFRDLEPVRYRGVSSPDDEEYLGFIAEDVPDLVAMNSRQGLSPMDIVALLTRVVQDQQHTIEQLSERLSQLEGSPEAPPSDH